MVLNVRPDIWFDEAGTFDNKFPMVKIEGKGYNFIKIDGEYLRPDIWFDDACYFSDRSSCTQVKIKGKEYYVNADGVILDKYYNWVNI